VRLYDTTDDVEAVQRFYDSWMKGHGFAKAAVDEPPGVSYTRADGYQAFMALSTRHDRTSIALSEAGRADGTSTAIVQVGE
jgi:hypothetical protein